MSTTAHTPSSASPIHFGHQGRVVLITGGAQGIGAACTRRFAREGGRVVLADVADAPGQALATELGGLYVHCDVGSQAQVNSTVAQVVAAHGRIDVLVNNAGIFKARPTFWT
jgi:NAD(P)-dependent dehydrogenase (short-subunit alcohol dehydrogenase family)